MKASTCLWSLFLLLLLILPSGFVRGTGNKTHAVKVQAEYYGIDYDCDGFGDAAYGSPFSTVNGKPSAGAVNVVYGTGTGLKKTGNQLWHLGTLGLSVGVNEGFGLAIASADIDHDGCTELIVGAPGRDSSTGAVYVIKGSKQGLQKSGFMELHGQTEFEFYGWSVAAGDFDHDDFFDIAVGSINSKVGTKFQAGAVYVDYGPSLSSNRRQKWTLNSKGMKGAAKTGDLWGYTLRTGNFNGDLFDDLVVGAPYGQVGTKDDAGFVSVLYGSNKGIGSNRNQLIDLTLAEAEDLLGAALSTCYCDDDGFEDLLFSAPGRFNSKGIVFLVQGSNNGVILSAGQALTDPEGQEGDRFGAAMATVGVTGRFGIYVGSPGADVEIGSQVRTDAGLFTIFGSVTAPGVYEYQTRNNGTDSTLARKAGDQLGSSFSVTANENGVTTLLIGAPQADVGGKVDAGAAISYRIDLNDYTRLTNAISWDRGKLAGAPEKEGAFGLRLVAQVRF